MPLWAAVVERALSGVGDLNPVHGRFDLRALRHQKPALLVDAAFSVARNVALVDEGHGPTIRPAENELAHCRGFLIEPFDRATSRSALVRTSAVKEKDGRSDAHLWQSQR